MNELKLTHPNHFAVYVNLWGTSAKLTHGEGTLFQPSLLLSCQTHFHTELARTSASHPEIDVYGFGDYAYLIGSDLGLVITSTCKLFQSMTRDQDHFRFWPLRAACARGLSQMPVTSGRNPHMPWIGPGLVLAAEIEKSAPKGARFLVSGDIQLDSAALLSRSCSVRGQEHREINWLSNYLAEKVDDQTIEASLTQSAHILMDDGTNFTQQMGASIRDLLRWHQMATQGTR